MNIRLLAACLAGIGMNALLPMSLLADPIVDVRFNDAHGDQSLANVGTAGGTGLLLGNAAYATSTPAVNTGGQSIQFDGNGDYVNYGNIGALNGVQSFTITGWIKFSTANQTTTLPRLLSYKVSASSSAGIDLYIANAGTTPKLSLGVDGVIAGDTTTLTADQWVFFAVSYDGTQTTDNLKYYVGDANGVTLSSTKTLDAGAVNVVAGQSLYLGGIITTPTPNLRDYTGLMDDITITGASSSAGGVLTLEQINAIRNQSDVVPEAATATSLLAGACAMLIRRR